MPDEAIGKYAHELLQSVFPVPIEEIHAELLRSGRWDGELEKTRADGTRLVVSARWSLRRDEQGRPAAILATNNDITERKRREQEILTLNEELGKRSAQLEASNKELEAFAYSVSHDLRAHSFSLDFKCTFFVIRRKRHGRYSLAAVPLGSTCVWTPQLHKQPLDEDRQDDQRDLNADNRSGHFEGQNELARSVSERLVFKSPKRRSCKCGCEIGVKSS